ncbi:MAG: AMP-binding protein [Hyphomicrobiales bacterium]|nr:AMP-binding protein [Hyphomicrobiales bacterium]MBV8825976.1 AMP-binding protein [Hyphomicrobiales bacterium]MBV9428537.1 AMP-binding protein [Bradyrhizobiaceae bacterium]
MSVERRLDDVIAALGRGRLILADRRDVAVSRLWEEASHGSDGSAAWPWRSGDRVILAGPRGAELFLAVLAIWKSGGVPVLGANDEIAAEWRGETALWRWSDRVKLCDGPRIDTAPAAVIHASSGTTGHPKLAKRSFESLLAEAERYVARYSLAAGHRTVLVAPIEHSFAFGALLGALAGGGCAELFDVVHPRRLARLLHSGGADVVILTPTIARLAIEAAEPSLQIPKRPPETVIAGAGPVPESLDHAFRRTFGVGLGRNYGCSETGATFGAPHSLPQGCLGPPFHGVGIRSPGVGAGPEELVLELGHEILGIEGQPQAPSLKQGIWRTGDIARLGEDGTVALLGRIDDQLKINGHLVDGGRLVDRARRIERVSDAMAFAIPRTDRAEISDLVLVCETDHVLPGEIAGKLDPATNGMPVTVLTVGNFPRGPAGKPDRKVLEQLARVQLGRSSHGAGDRHERL